MTNTVGVSVKTVTFRHEAELVVLGLGAAGIDAWLVDHFLVSADPLISNAVGGIKVHVAEADEARAREIVAELERPATDDVCLACGAPMPRAEPRCPACGWSYLSGG
ncbi:MAG: hypothetical protein SFW67_23335 [Myxococcaceae bacterium]|nr:hypothetical protein [Myxococcaceae bacterium]